MAKNLTIRIEDKLKDLLEESARTNEVASVTEYIIKVLERLLLEQYDPFLFRPGPRKETERNKTFEDDRALLKELCEQADELAADDPEDARRTVFLTVPRALHIPGADLSDYRSWEMLVDDFRDALNSNIVIKRLYIDAFNPDKQWSDKEYVDLRRADEEFRQKLLVESPKERLLRERKRIPPRDQRVFFKHVSAFGVMGNPGLEADRERLNDFNVYGDLAVSFTTATSYGLPFSCILSRSAEDINYWTRRFRDLWRDAEREEEKRPGARGTTNASLAGGTNG
jgi:hypothetical protein